MDLTWGQLFGLAVTSGAAAGLANQVFKFGHDWLADQRTKDSQRRELDHQEAMQARELQHQRDLQEEERDHAVEIRSEVAFFDARNELLTKAVGVYDWVQWYWGDLYGADVDYYAISVFEPDYHTPADAIGALSAIAGRHPLKEVRNYARALGDSIDAASNQPGPGARNDGPGVKLLANWSKRAGELIDALHDPEHQLVEPSAIGK